MYFRNIFERPLHILFPSAIFLWCYLFRGFFTGENYFVSDGVSYYNHIKFFVESLAQGVYPIWDPHWYYGSPNEFFLRRLGSFTPFFYPLVLLVKIGVPFLQAYWIFIAGYWFFGCFGFYKLTNFIFKDKRCAFLAFLLIYFSSLGGRLFDSYLILEFTPYVWFFYCLLKFSTTPQKYTLLGLTLFLNIILTTYVPLYFFIIFVYFLLCLADFFPKTLLNVLKKYLTFTLNNAVLVIFCLCTMGLSTLPGIHMIQDGNKSEVVLSHRSSTSEETNVLTVGKETVTEWGILEDLTYSYAFSDLRKFKFAVMYVPILAFLILLLGVFVPMNKRLIFFFVWGFLIFMCHSPHLPVYGWLYENVKIYKYFRNLHFFLWLALLPIFVLFIADLFKRILSAVEEGQISKNALLVFNILGHMLAFGFLYYQGNALVISYLSVALSFGLFWFLIYCNNTFDAIIYYGLFVIAVLQPVVAYGSLHRNTEKLDPALKGRYYHYETNLTDFRYVSEWEQARLSGYPMPPRGQIVAGDLYYGVQYFDYLVKNVNKKILRKFLDYKVRIFDNLQAFENSENGFRQLNKAMADNLNIAFIDGENSELLKKFKPESSNVGKVEIISEDSNEIQLKSYSANHISFQTGFDKDVFLVLNDNYDERWQAYLNGALVKIVRTNVAFKGVVVPKGENIIEMRYGTAQQLALNRSLSALFLILLCGYGYYRQRELNA